MIRGTNHILVSHAGTLPKPEDLREMVIAKAGGQPIDEEALTRRIRESVAEVVKKQVAIGIDTINDGEMSKASFTAYIRDRIRELTDREYIDPGQSTVDYVLFFIPNEGVFGFIREEDPEIFDSALTSKVVCCSPLTLFAVLSVVRQAVDNFALEQTANEILSLMGQFYRQWDQFGESVKTVERRLTLTQKAFEEMAGRRTRALSRPLQKIDELRQRSGILIAESEDTGDAPDPLVLEPGENGSEGISEPGT